MKAKSAIHGARAAADIKEAAKTAANSRSTQASKQASARAANVVRHCRRERNYKSRLLEEIWTVISVNAVWTMPTLLMSSHLNVKEKLYMRVAGIMVFSKSIRVNLTARLKI